MRRSRIRVGVLTLSGLMFFSAPDACGVDRSTNLSFVFENDAGWLGGKSDHYYTNGLRLEWTKAGGLWPPALQRTVRKLVELGGDRGAGAFLSGFALAQLMYTPDSIMPSDAQPGDRPYAGWLYLAYVADLSTNLAVHHFEASIGVTGAASLADSTQTMIHRLLAIDVPHGWAHQLPFEPTLQMNYSQRRSQFIDLPGPINIDFMPGASLGVGTVMDYAGLSVSSHIGFVKERHAASNDMPYHLALDGSTRPSSFALYAFGGLSGRFVVRNMFLDGAIFSKSPHVEKRFFVGDMAVGAVLEYRGVQLTCRRVHRSRDFHAQKGVENYGAIGARFRFGCD